LALVLVGSVHLLTTSGNWAILDHGEILYTARHLLHHGTFDLTPAGVPRLKFMPTVVARPGQPVRSRFLPIPTLTLVPLLYADERLGWADDRAFGHIVHLQGHAFVLAALVLLGLAVRRSGGGDSAAAVAVVLAGLAWPVWLVSRRVGPEPVMLFLICAYILGESAPQARSSHVIRAGVCLLLPWTHVTGPHMSAALFLGSALRIVTRREGPVGRRLRELAPMAAATVVGTATMVYFWNHRFHGNWVRGGYALTDPVEVFGVHGMFAGIFEHLTALVLLLPVTLPLAVIGITRAGPRSAAAFWPIALSVTTVVILIFCTFYWPEPSRRLAVACPAWAGIVGSTWDRLRLRTPLAQAAIAAQSLAGFAWFMHVDGGWTIGPRGLNLPQYVLWADLLRAGRPWWIALGPVVALLVIMVLAAARVWALLCSEDARLDRAAATP
jgi:hypothetical protein